MRSKRGFITLLTAFFITLVSLGVLDRVGYPSDTPKHREWVLINLCMLVIRVVQSLRLNHSGARNLFQDIHPSCQPPTHQLRIDFWQATSRHAHPLDVGRQRVYQRSMEYER